MQIKYFVLLLAIAFSGVCLGQEAPSTVVESPIEVHPENAEKVSTVPVTPEEGPVELDYQHDPMPAITRLDFGEPQIRVRGLPSPKNEEINPQSFYLRAGFGTPMSPLAEISYHLSENERVEFGITYRHHSARSQSNDLMRFSRHHATIQGAYFLEQGIGVGGELSYDWYGLRFFGTDNSDSSFTENDLTQRFSRFSGKARVFNSVPNELGINYGLDFGLYALGDHFLSSELGIDLLVKANKRFSERFSARLDAGMEWVSFSDTSTQKVLVPFAQPAIFFNTGGFRAKVGGWIGSDAGTFFGSPDVELSYNFFNGGFAIFAGWNGGVRLNSFDRLTRYNPFLNSVVEIRNTRWQERFGGVRGSSNGISYEARFAQRPMNVMPMFINDGRAGYGRFDVLYDTLSMLTISGNVSFNRIKNFTATFQAAYHLYNETNWGLPNLDANLILRYFALKKKLLLKSEFYTMSGVNFVSEVGETDVIAPLYDLNFGVEYNINKNFGLFLDLNNVLNTKRERWFRYPQFGFNLMGGVTVKF